MELREYHDKLGAIRRRVGDILNFAREAFVGAMRSDSNVFNWYGESFWVDRERCLVLPMFTFDEPPAGYTLGKDDALEALELYGGAARWRGSERFASVLGGMLAGTIDRQVWASDGAHLLNLAVVQPLVNPAFAPLFWLAFARDSCPPGPIQNFYDIVGPMMFEMMSFPTLLPSKEEVRRSQGRFLCRLSSGSIGSDVESLSEEEWLRTCIWQLHAERSLMNRLLDQIWSRAGSAAFDAFDANDVQR